MNQLLTLKLEFYQDSENQIGGDQATPDGVTPDMPPAAKPEVTEISR